MSFDAIVIGSGFGGAVCASRLAEAGLKVLVLERGRWWTHDPNNRKRTPYPREPGDPWIWDADEPEQQNGWMDLRVFNRIAVVQGAAVGGGSLIYANISCEATPENIATAFPPEITYDELKPRYDTVARFMRVQTVPVNQWPPRTHIVKEAAERIGAGDRFRPLPLAVSFDEGWSYDLDEPRHRKHTTTFVNDQGVEQGTCVHLGECDIGCPVRAKNTLDLNYIPWALKHGAEVRELHLVNHIEPVSGGYRVHCDRIDPKHHRLHPTSETARIVIVAAGSLGSTELLLRCRDQHRTLRGLSRRLGQGWCSNGDFLTPAFHSDRDVRPNWGPTITSAIDFLDRSRSGQSFWIQDGGFPDLLEAYLRRKRQRSPRGIVARLLVETVNRFLRDDDAIKGTMPWFAQGVDDPGGVMRLRRRWWLFGPKRLQMKYDPDAAEAVIEAIITTHKELADATGGEALVPPTWSLRRYLVTPHPLGGCNIGHDVADGVVDHLGEVFGHRNLFVIDGAIIPAAIGVNPSRTIAALAERNVAAIIARG